MATLRRLPGPMCLFWWAFWTVTAPLVIYSGTSTVERIAFEGPDLNRWIVGAAVFPAAAAAWRFPGDRPRAIVAGLASWAIYLAGTVIVYRWVFPLEHRPVTAWVLAGAGPALLGALAATLLRPRPRTFAAPLVAGVLLALAGAWITPTTLFEAARYSALTPLGPEPPVTSPTELTVTDPGRYGLFTDVVRAKDAHCGLTDPAGNRLRPHPLTVRLEVTTGVDMRAPRAVLWLLGALPGLWLAAAAGLRVRGARRQPA